MEINTAERRCTGNPIRCLLAVQLEPGGAGGAGVVGAGAGLGAVVCGCWKDADLGGAVGAVPGGFVEGRF